MIVVDAGVLVQMEFEFNCVKLFILSSVIIHLRNAEFYQGSFTLTTANSDGKIFPDIFLDIPVVFESFYPGRAPSSLKSYHPTLC